jgi:hypothetical protein
MGFGKGWYFQPDGSRRYWDGSQWVGETIPAAPETEPTVSMAEEPVPEWAVFKVPSEPVPWSAWPIAVVPALTLLPIQLIFITMRLNYLLAFVVCWLWFFLMAVALDRFTRVDIVPGRTGRQKWWTVLLFPPAPLVYLWDREPTQSMLWVARLSIGLAVVSLSATAWATSPSRLTCESAIADAQDLSARHSPGLRIVSTSDVLELEEEDGELLACGTQAVFADGSRSQIKVTITDVPGEPVRWGPLFPE